MGRSKPEHGAKKEKKPKTLIQLKREERKGKKLLPRPPRPATAHPKPRDPDVSKIVRPKPKPQNPGYQKWMALFKREITMIETHLKHSERFRQHWRAQIDNMEDPEEKSKWESGEVGNFKRLLTMMERTKEILVQAREMSAWIVPRSKLGLGKNLPGMKDFALGAEKNKSEGTDAKADDDAMDTDEDEAAPADFIPLNIVTKAQKPSNGATDESKKIPATETAESNPFFVVDIEPTPVNLNGTLKKSKKRVKENDGEDKTTAKKAKKEKAAVIEPKPQIESVSASTPKPKSSKAESESESEPELESTFTPKPRSSKVDFSSIETKLQVEIEAGTKAKAEREKAKAEKLAKKAKKRKRLSEGDSEKDVKKAKKEKQKEKKRKPEGSGDEEVLSDEGSKKKHKAVT